MEVDTALRNCQAHAIRQRQLLDLRGGHTGEVDGVINNRFSLHHHLTSFECMYTMFFFACGLYDRSSCQYYTHIENNSLSFISCAFLCSALIHSRIQRFRRRCALRHLLLSLNEFNIARLVPFELYESRQHRPRIKWLLFNFLSFIMHISCSAASSHATLNYRFLQDGVKTGQCSVLEWHIHSSFVKFLRVSTFVENGSCHGLLPRTEWLWYRGYGFSRAAATVYPNTWRKENVKESYRYMRHEEVGCSYYVFCKE